MKVDQVKELVNKPVVLGNFSVDQVKFGKSNVVLNVSNHPKLGYQQVVHTSVVISIFEDGFETYNTLYKNY